MIHSLCETCALMREVVTPKGSRFLLCQLSQTDPAYPKYPPQPVVRCDGYQKKEQVSVNDLLRRKWHDLLRAWAVDPSLAERTFEDVREHHAGPVRFYHTLSHVQNVLETVESLGSNARNLNAVKLAAWLHDVIYDSRASDNEERSAEYAERLCENLSIPERRLAASLILKTKTHDAGGDADAEVLLDADLAILGASEAVYRIYRENIRKEYAWVPEAAYRDGRRQILERFLARPRIFYLLCRLEAPARQNLAAEIAQLADA